MPQPGVYPAPRAADLNHPAVVGPAAVNCATHASLKTPRLQTYLDMSSGAGGLCLVQQRVDLGMHVDNQQVLATAPIPR